MPKIHKPSESMGEPAKNAVAADDAAGAEAPASKAAQGSKSAAKVTGSAKRPAGAVGATGSGKAAAHHAKPDAPAKAGTEPARKHLERAPATNATGAKAASGRGGAAKVAPAPPYPPAPADDDQPRVAFLAEQRVLLVEERAGYVRQADELKAEADSLALEHEPGDVQFDEEGGEGGTSNVDRELDLVLSAQARSAITEIDRAMIKIEAGTYGTCEQCGRPIPQARLKALPYAALCVACKSGGLSRR
jgi:DnaK suppressor protein